MWLLEYDLDFEKARFGEEPIEHTIMKIYLDVRLSAADTKRLILVETQGREIVYNKAAVKWLPIKASKAYFTRRSYESHRGFNSFRNHGCKVCVYK